MKTLHEILLLCLVLLSVECVSGVSGASMKGVCREGGCCDTGSGVVRAKGTPCTTNPCYLPNTCTGDNPYCPTGGVQRPNGTICPEGVCFMGKCKQATKCMGDCCDKSGESLIDGAPCLGGSCLDGICRSFPACMNDCCNNKGKALEDGTPCAQGNCLAGMCTNLDKTCKAGKCCDLYKKIIRPKGFPCTNNPCAEKVKCDGSSEICPPAVQFKLDGTPCPTGVCLAGVCTKSATPLVNVDQNGKLVEVPKVENKTAEVKKPTGTALEIHHHFVASPSCNEGPCCDMVEKKVLDEGRKCANKTCHMGVCDGRSAGCAYVYSFAGTPCPDGRCLEGKCIKNCLGQCCRSDGVTPKSDGSVCHDGYCFAGYCVKSCKDDCCETINGVPHAKADGSSCKNGDGYCVKGECKLFTVPVFKPRENTQPAVIPDEADVKIFTDAFKQSFVKNFFRAAAKVGNDQIDEEERKTLKKKLDQAKAAEMADRALEEQAILNQTMKALSLSAAQTNVAATSSFSSSDLFSGTNLIFLIAGCATALVVFIIVVVALAKTGKKKAKKETDTDHGDFSNDYKAPEPAFEDEDDKKYKF